MLLLHGEQRQSRLDESTIPQAESKDDSDELARGYAHKKLQRSELGATVNTRILRASHCCDAAVAETRLCDQLPDPAARLPQLRLAVDAA